MKTRPPSTACAAMAVTVLLASCSAGPAETGNSGGKVTFVSSGGAFQDAQIEAWQKPFDASTGTQFNNDGPLDLSKMKSMVDAKNVSWDALDVSSSTASQYCGTYLEKLDYTVIDKGLYPEGSAGDCGVPAYGYAQLMLYNTDSFGSNPPASAADFFDLQKYPGKRLLPPNFDIGLLEFSLLADGVAKEDLYPLDVPRALRKLDTIKSELIFTTTYAQVQQALEASQAEMALSLTARTVLAVKNGAPYDAVWDSVMMNTDSIVIPKGAANKDAAMKFIASLSGAEQQKTFSELTSSLPVSADVTPQYNETQKKFNPFDHQESLIYSNADWWGQNLDAVTSLYNTWKVS